MLKPDLPSLVLGLPLIKEFLLGSSLAYERLIRSCCVKKIIGGFDFQASRVLLKGRDGSRSIAEMGRRLNYSFNIGEWKPVRKGVIDHTLMIEEAGRQKVNHKIAYATAGEARKWMEACDHAKQQAEYEISRGVSARNKLNKETEYGYQS
ncbi:hypothetical protein Q3G72_019583 [Acer saccharum]|nr:hypothetical protein Q3G72_019583 [Acer saccharum]